MYPILFQIGPIRIATYGLMMATGFLVGMFVLKRELARKGLDLALADRIVLATMVGGVVGAKLFHVLEFPERFIADPIGTVFSGYGLAFYGGMMGATGAVVWTLKRHNALDLRVPDAMAPGLVAGYFFGRGGCQLSGDGCYGVATDLPWGMSYPNGTVPTLERVHPAPVYEMLEMLAVFCVLWMLRTRIRRPGVLFCAYLVLVGVARFAVEFVRRNPSFYLGLTTHQWVSISAVLFGVIFAIWLSRRTHGAAGDRVSEGSG